ncbi:MAG: hypothetical protein IKJ08_04750 [Alistipes sp.]|nr:hypothetical protein [Alistipes sp.]
MKKYFAVFVVALLSLVGCDDPLNSGNDGPTGNLEGQWHIVEWNGTEPEFDVYLSFNDGSFDIYQQVWTLDYQHFYGAYIIKGSIINGQYVDGVDWACGYKFNVSGDTLTLHSQEDNSVTSVYKSCVIPQDVITEATTTRVEGATPFL